MKNIMNFQLLTIIEQGIEYKLTYVYKDINDKKVAIVMSQCYNNEKNITDIINTISEKLEVENIIYRFMEEGGYDYWSKKLGFRSLALQGKDTMDVIKAINIAKVAYIK
jgi:hypothetical protein